MIKFKEILRSPRGFFEFLRIYEDIAGSERALDHQLMTDAERKKRSFLLLEKVMC